jgi:hydroxyacylglutathione hydrolase
MIHEVFPVGVLQCNCSVFGDESTHQAIVIDPGADIERILETLHRHQLKLKAIVITHAHIDHIGGAEKLRASTGAPVWMNAADKLIALSLPLQAAWLGVSIPANPGVDVEAKEGDTLLAGTTEFHVLETPGHTPGSISLYIPTEGKLIAGDTLFRDSIGRTDLPGGSQKKLVRSIHDKLFTLPDPTVVIPGHGMNTTIEREKRLNPFVGALARS